MTKQTEKIETNIPVRRFMVTKDQRDNCFLWPESSWPNLRYCQERLEWTTDGLGMGARIEGAVRRALIGKRNGNHEVVVILDPKK